MVDKSDRLHPDKVEIKFANHPCQEPGTDRRIAGRRKPTFAVGNAEIVENVMKPNENKQNGSIRSFS